MAKKHPLYSVWKDMRRRCLNPKRREFKHYGGRGIKVCERWNDYALFHQDMIHGWRKGLTLERINNNGSYEPGNCRWATRKEQRHNSRQSREITIDGVTRSITEWSRLRFQSHSLVNARLRLGWPIETALNTPIMRKTLAVPTEKP